MKTFIIVLTAATLSAAQTYLASDVKGDVKVLSGIEEKWESVQDGTILKNDAVISTGKNSSVHLQNGKFNFVFGSESAVSINSIKKMSLDELLLALAMEDLVNTPKTKSNGSSGSTATYGTEENGKNISELQSGSFGIKRLNGAMQLADNGMTESAVVFAKETYRKYPDTKLLASYRIFFAGLLYEKGLYEEAYKDYSEIILLELSTEQKSEVNSSIENIKKILMSN
jgi:hypothetical protein